MQFRGDKAIYAQIQDFVIEKILSKNWETGSRIPSIRDLAVEMEVNPNTVNRAYSNLQDQGIIYNKRGIGYFIEEDAYSEVINFEKDNFINETLPKIFKKMKLLDISFEELKSYYSDYSDKEGRE